MKLVIKATTDDLQASYGIVENPQEFAARYLQVLEEYDQFILPGTDLDEVRYVDFTVLWAGASERLDELFNDFQEWSTGNGSGMMDFRLIEDSHDLGEEDDDVNLSFTMSYVQCDEEGVKLRAHADNGSDFLEYQSLVSPWGLYQQLVKPDQTISSILESLGAK